MKGIVLTVLLLIAVSVAINAQELTQCPIDGMYESVANSAYLDGKPAAFTPWVRIGVKSMQRRVLWIWDSDNDGTLEDEDIDMYAGQFYRDGVEFTDSAGSKGFFVFMNNGRVYRLVTFTGTKMMQIDFMLIEEW